VGSKLLFCVAAVTVFLIAPRASATTPGEQRAARLLAQLRVAKDSQESDRLLLELSRLGPEARCAGPLLAEMLKRKPDPSGRAALAMESLGAEGVPYLRQLLRSNDRETRFSAQLMIYHMEWGNGELVPDLAAVALRETIPHQETPIIALGRVHENRAAAARVLCRWMMNRQDNEAGYALASLHAPARETIPTLEWAITSHPSGYMRMQAIYALEEIDAQGSNLEHALEKALSDKSPSYLNEFGFPSIGPAVGKRAAEILARRRARSPAVLLGNRRLEDVAADFYQEAIDEDDLKGGTAITLLSQRPDVLRAFIDWMMRETASKNFGNHAEGSAAFRWGFERLRGRQLDVDQLARYSRSTDVDVRFEAVGLLGDLPRPTCASIQALAGRLTDDNVRVRYAATIGLQNAGRRALPALPALRRAATCDRYDCVRRIANATLASLESRSPVTCCCVCRWNCRR
jgi:HEAT repeat protein